MTRTLVLGIGNTLLSDEGSGIHLLRHLQQQDASHEEVTYLDGGTLSFTLAADIEDTDNLIVLDAAHLDEEAGAIRCLTGQDMDNFLGTSKRSVHEVGLLDLLDIARLTDSLPQRRALIGIQPAFMGWGEQPSAAVRAALPRAAQQVRKLISDWHQPAHPTDPLDGSTATSLDGAPPGRPL